MAFGLLARKKGMTTLIDENGLPVPVTVLVAGPCTVVDIRTKKSNGYDALQLGFEAAKPHRTNKPTTGHFAKKNLPPQRQLQEFRIEEVAEFTVGQQVTVEGFQKGEEVDVRGCVKGRGTQGVIKRWGKAGGPAAHGSHFHRTTGSIGQRTWPGRVFKNMKMPGHMGAVNRTIRGLKVVAIDPTLNLLFIQGSVPGANNGLVRVTCRGSVASRFAKSAQPTPEVSAAETTSEGQG